MSTWSLPGRALARGKHNDTNSHLWEKSSTVHASPSWLHQRRKLSHVFSSLSEKRINQDVANQESPLAAARQQTLSSSAGNTLQNCIPRSCHVLESPVSRPSNALHLVDSPDHPTPNVNFELDGPLFTPIPGAVGNVPYQPDESIRLNRRGHTIGEEGFTHLESLAGDGEVMKSRMALEEVRSRSSSYPSEGIRTPISSPLSPPPTQATENLIAEYVRYGTWPTRALQTTSDSSIDQWMAEHLTSSQNQAIAPVSARCNSVPIGVDRNDGSLHRPSYAIIRDKSRNTSTSEGVSLMSPSHPSSPETRDATGLDPLLQSACQVQEQGNRSNPKPDPPQATESMAGNIHAESDNATTFGLRLSTTLDNYTSSVRRTGPQEFTLDDTTDTPDSPQSTFPPAQDTRRLNSLEIPMLARTCSPTSHISTASSVSQRIRQFKLVKWVKKVSSRSKVRFDGAMKPTPFSTTSHPLKEVKLGRNIRRGIRYRMHRTHRRPANRLLARVRQAKKQAQRERKKAAKETRHTGATTGRQESLMLTPPHRPETSGILRRHGTILKIAASCPVLPKQWNRTQCR